MTIEPIDHTADVGVDLEAGSLEALYAEAAAAFTDTITELGTVAPGEERRLSLSEADRELLLVEWLGELLFLFDTEEYLVRRAEIELGERDGVLELTAVVSGERFDPRRHPVKVAIKGITYHGLAVRREGGRWRGRVIFDI